MAAAAGAAGVDVMSRVSQPVECELIVEKDVQVPMRDGTMIAEGLVGSDVDPDVAKDCARQCAINALAAAQSVIGSLDRVTRVVKVVGFVASAPGFTGQPAVINGASELLLEIFGDAGRHARSAVGVAGLPINAPVEVEMVLAVAD